MSEIFEIRDQVKLSFARSMEFVLSGIQYRFFRSSVTVGVICLAVAFLMTMLGITTINTGVKNKVSELLHGQHTLSFWMNRLNVPVGDLEIIEAFNEKDIKRINEFKKWADESNFDDISEMAPTAKEFLIYFSRLSEGQQRRLLGRQRGCNAFDAMASDQSAFEAYKENISTIGDPPPASLEVFENFLRAWSATSEKRQKIIKGHTVAIQKFASFLGEKNIEWWLSELDEKKVNLLAELGFSMSKDEAELVKETALLNRHASIIESLIKVPKIKQRFCVNFSVSNPSDLEMDDVYRKLQTVSGAEWFMSEIKDNPSASIFTVDSVREISKKILSEKKLAMVDASLQGAETEGKIAGLPSRLAWLIIVSLVVCAVGITNAMLMSVTERFTEIATMKCLGASDRFILIIFILESGIQGGLGGAIGSFLGFLLAVLRGVWQYGFLAIKGAPWGLLALEGIACSLVGVLLSMLAALYPAMIASRLAPMEAMRVE